MRNQFLIIGTILIASVFALWLFDLITLWVLIPIAIICIIGFHDAFQKKHTILRNFPLIGHFRYLFESISPEIQQYFIERNTDGRPFSRNYRALVYQRAKDVNDTRPFGTQLELNNSFYEGLRHSIYAKSVKEELPRIIVGGADCKKPYEASLLNVSAMSFGSLSANAIMALNAGARKGNFYHNTGEGGISPYHLKHGGDLVWQIGTAYFGCRTENGEFDPEEFKKKAHYDQVKMIEIKLSQGAKPGHGGVLPAIKNTPEIAKIRGLQPHTEVHSPPSHSHFSDAKGLLEFVQELRELSDGKPIGFKLCIGNTEEFDELCQEMVNSGIKPDFITVDGAEGGTGAAPLEFSDSVGLPLQPALIYVNENLKKHNIRNKIKVIASGKIISSQSIIKMLALGADFCNSARAFMFSVGCIQALRCNTNACPTGVATQNKNLQKGLVMEEKSERVYNFHRNTVKAAMEMLAACGLESIDEVTMDIFLKGNKFVSMENEYFPEKMDGESRH
ncbi:FMN-binding glutamate synthase family protein [Marivirga salinae]|uniref:FMN-binding glutamate synthase family protein n=1 Tax=Marivirga salinarum TaxID=3059078 RepID=A0AA51NCG3_9BACT|nr:FMN-binding glutamate synthase family protein [Marivirga sp. BDSF4-3]WMN11036.1 FMN-binding glutamate synthase family protein [Marivirga sp. BDSF4-3]